MGTRVDELNERKGRIFQPHAFQFLTTNLFFLAAPPDKTTRRRLADFCFRLRRSPQLSRNKEKMSNASTITNLFVLVYILSGVSQPLLMTVCKNAGLAADSKAQLYMLFYYAGPTFLLLTLLPSRRRSVTERKTDLDTRNSNNNTTDNSSDDGDGDNDDEYRIRPSTRAILKACLIALFDIAAQSLNYTGASLAGATIFSIIYSSVTVWTAVFSRLFLGRSLNRRQWLAVFVVFGGLCITAVDSSNLGASITQGTVLILAGSCMHGATYVMSEAVMTVSGNAVAGTALDPASGIREKLTVRENAAIQGLVAFLGLLGWQFLYTAGRWEEAIRQPMEAAGTTLVQAGVILCAFALANLLHSFSFYHTLANYPGGSTSAGVMKGLQAVLVFVAAHFLYCGSTGGNGMCFSVPKFLSLVTVVGGVVLFSAATDRSGASWRGNNEGYTQVGSIEVVAETLTV